MPEDPITLSASAARMVVAAASTGPSEASTAAKQGVSRLLGRGDTERQLLAELQLDQTRDELQATAGQEREQARAALEAVWRTQLADLLAEDQERLANCRIWWISSRKSCIMAWLRQARKRASAASGGMPCNPSLWSSTGTRSTHLPAFC